MPFQTKCHTFLNLRTYIEGIIMLMHVHCTEQGVFGQDGYSKQNFCKGIAAKYFIVQCVYRFNK